MLNIYIYAYNNITAKVTPAYVRVLVGRLRLVGIFNELNATIRLVQLLELSRDLPKTIDK